MKRITDESDLIEKKGAIEDDGDEFVGSSKAFKNHQEEKEEFGLMKKTKTPVHQ